MLKIKDNVDLKELEKITYKNNIRIDENTRKIELLVDHFYEVDDKSYDTLYDLIEAGLVEKVEE